jgi:hypothetical protein
MLSGERTRPRVQRMAPRHPQKKRRMSVAELFQLRAFFFFSARRREGACTPQALSIDVQAVPARGLTFCFRRPRLLVTKGHVI